MKTIFRKTLTIAFLLILTTVQFVQDLEPALIRKHAGFEFESSKRMAVESGELVLVNWRSSGRGRYFQFDLFWVKDKHSPVKKISVPDLPHELYAGEASLGQTGAVPRLEVRVALTGPFYSAPYIYKTYRYSWHDGTLISRTPKLTRPKDATQYLNLGRYFLAQKQYQRSIHFYVEGLKLQHENPGYVDEPILAEIHIDLAKAYVGTSRMDKARKVLHILIESYPATSQTKRAIRILKKLPR